MPLTIPTLDDRRYQDLRNEALARISVHNPEWTNFNESDPGVTLLELFAFLTENLLYRSNQIPERNRLKFLSLLGIPLQAASPAVGLVTFVNERGPLQTVTLNNDLEVRAGSVPFRTERGLDVLPVETQVYFKRRLEDPTGKLAAYYSQLYASYKGQPPDSPPVLYETVPMTAKGNDGVDLGQEAIDHSLWIALLLRAGDKSSDRPLSESLEEARQTIAGKMISLGIIPLQPDPSRHVLPQGETNLGPHLQYQIPNIPVSGGLPADPRLRVPQYLPLDANVPNDLDVLSVPGVVEMTLPQDTKKLALWNNLDPLELGVGDFPPTLDDTKLNERVITWLRISAPDAARGQSAGSPASLRVQLLWVGINTAFVKQRAYVANELLPLGTGEPDQSVTLSKTPVIDGSVQLTVTNVTGVEEKWQEIDDLLSAGAEVPVPDPRLPPGAFSPQQQPAKVFTVNPESGELRFGDGMHGARPPFNATLRADYAYSVGPGGNVGPDSINTGPALPAGIKVTNPIRTWGGATAETVSEGEKQIARYVQHHDRLVNASDYESITLRTPGIDIGRVEVVPAYSPALGPNLPGDAPGAVTLMVIPQYDPVHPSAPVPDQLFLDTIVTYLDPRRLVTTELFVRGPVYKDIWVSVGVQAVPGASVAQVRDAVKQAIAQFLSPLPVSPEVLLDNQAAQLAAPQYASTQRGWPLLKPVLDREVLAVASRVDGVLLINDVLIAQGGNPPTQRIPMNGLELPRLAGMFVSLGDPMDMDQVRGQGGPTPTPTPTPPQGPPGPPQPGPTPTPTPAPRMPPFVPLPALPPECQ